MRLIERCSIQRLADSLTARRLVDDDILDPRTNGRRNTKHHERKQPDNLAVDARSEQDGHFTRDDFLKFS